MPEVDVLTLVMAWIDYKKAYDSVPPFVDAGMPEALQGRPKVSDFYKAINAALEDSLICKLKEYHRRHH